MIETLLREQRTSRETRRFLGRDGDTRRRARARARNRHRGDLGDPLGDEPRVRAVGSGPGARLESEMTRLLPHGRPRSIAIACGLGAASSSCSYAAMAPARSIFRRGANTEAVALAFSSKTRDGPCIILASLMGWQFTLAEFVVRPIMRFLITGDARMMSRADSSPSGQRRGCRRRSPRATRVRMPSIPRLRASTRPVPEVRDGIAAQGVLARV